MKVKEKIELELNNYIDAKLIQHKDGMAYDKYVADKELGLSGCVIELGCEDVLESELTSCKYRNMFGLGFVEGLIINNRYLFRYNVADGCSLITLPDSEK